MIKEFVEKWEKNKQNLEQYFLSTRQKEYSSYKDIVRALFDKVINIDEYEEDKFDIQNIVEINDGDYQGTEIFILHKDTYQPEVEDYVYTNTYYGSCSGCDTLLAISSCDDDIPDKEQVKEYMTLALHLLQKCKYMTEEE